MIPVAMPQLIGNEAAYVADALARGQLSMGTYVQRFESGLAAACGVEHAVSCCNGTAALHLACLALGLQPGDEVLVPALTYVATANAVRYCGATPVFCDVDPETWNLDPADAARHVTSRTRGIVAVHLYGVPASMQRLADLCDARGLWLVEDAAEAIGARLGGHPVGGFGDMATLSFYGNKVITCFPGDTSILVKPAPGKGKSRVKQISKISVGDEVLAYNVETSEKRYRPVVATQHHACDMLVRVAFDNGNELRVTSDHPIYITHRGWVPAGQLVPGDAAVQYIYRGLKNIEQHNLWAGKKRPAHAEAIRLAHATGRFRTDRYAARGPAISAAYQGRPAPSLATRAKMRARQIERFSDPAVRAALSRSLHRVWSSAGSDELRRRRSETMTAIGADPLYRAKVSAGVRRAMEKETYWVNYFKGLAVKKNKAETALEAILDSVVPGEFVFNGDFSAGVRIGNLTPDFVHAGKKRKVIELFGVRWHSENEKNEKAQFYAGQGYESIFIWDTELKNQSTVAERVLAYAHNPGVKMVRVVSVTPEPFSGDVYNITVEGDQNYFARGILVHNCGEGGAVVTALPELAAAARLYRGQGVTAPGRYDHSVVGYNYRLGELQAAVGLAQLERLETHLDRRRAVCDQYRAWADAVGVRYQRLPPTATSADWMFTFVAPPGFGRDGMAARMAGAGVQTRPAFPLVPRLPMYSTGEEFPVAREVSERGLTLPTHGGLTEADVAAVCEAAELALLERAS